MTERGAFVVPIHDLDLTGRSVRFPITPAWLRGALEGCEAQPAGSTGQIDVHLTKTGNDVLVQGQVDAALVIPCARCLEPVEFRPHIELSLLLQPASSAGASMRKIGGHAPAAGTGHATGRGTAGHGGAHAAGGAKTDETAGASPARPANASAPSPSRREAGEHGAQRARSDRSKGPTKGPKSDDETEFDGDEADNDTYEGEEVVLDRFVREAILLESPIFPLCSEACEGIRPASDSALDSEGAVTDPRLLPLLELAKRRKLKE